MAVSRLIRIDRKNDVWKVIMGLCAKLVIGPRSVTTPITVVLLAFFRYRPNYI